MRKRGLQLPGYEGDKPFIYACFAGADRRRVAPFLRQLQQAFFRIGFDGDAYPSGAQARRMAARIQSAQLILMFYSERANSSPIWRYQVNYAIGLDKPICCVRLDDTEPQQGINLQSGGIENYDAYRARDESAFYPAFTKMAGVTQALIGDGVEGYPAGSQRVELFRRTGFYVAIAAAVAAITLAIVLPPRIRALRATQEVGAPEIEYLAVIHFTEPMIQEAVTLSLGKDEADAVFDAELADVTKLRICDNVCLKETDEMYYVVTNGRQWTNVNGYGTTSGTVADLRELSMLPNLTDLMLSGQAITDISPLTSLTKLTSLDISDNPITDLSPLQELTELTTLDISCVPAEDFSALLALPKLRTLHIRGLSAAVETAAQLPVTSLSVSGAEMMDGALARIATMEALTSLDLSGTDVTSIEPLAAMPNLTELNIQSCSALADLDALTRIPKLARVYINGGMTLAMPEETFTYLIEHGVEILL